MNRILPRTLLLAILLAPAALALDSSRHLTQYVHRIWQVSQGLPQAAVYSISQTRDGYLWLGTQTGLVRFDGVRFTSFENLTHSALDHAWISGIVEDANRNLWIAANEDGLFRIQSTVVKHYTPADGLPRGSVRCVVPGANGDLWVCTTTGLARVHDDKVETLASGNFSAVCQSPDGDIWAAGDGPRITILKGSQTSALRLKSLPDLGAVRALHCSAGGTIWAGTTSGLIRLDANKDERLFTTKDGLADNSILTLAESADGILWAGTKNGFSRVRGVEIESFRPKDGLSQSAVFALSEDREGSLWAGTKHGLNEFFDGRAVPFTVSEGLPSNDAGPVLQDRTGDVWVGTLGAGLGRYDGERFRAITAKQGLSSNFIYSLAEAANGDLWVGTSAGLDRVRDGRVLSAQRMPGPVRGLFVDHTGALWIASPSGLATLHGETLVHVSSDPILAIAEDHGELVAAVEGRGLYRLEDGKLREFGHVRDIDAFYQDPDGNLWMGTTGGGLRLLRNGKVTSYSVKNGLFDDEIYGIARDNDDRLWMACSKGIFSVTRADLLQFAAGKIKTFASNPYSPTDALRTIECKSGVQPAAWRMQNGRIWFSTIRGLIVIDPARLQRRLPPPAMVIEDVLVNGQREAPGQIAHLAPGRKNLEFDYTGLSYIMPTRLTFRYMLEGFDRDWIDAGTRREAYYTNLPPGKYRFRLTACNFDGTCNQSGGTVDFALAPAYYQRVWFWPAVAVAAALMCLAAYRLRIRQLRERFGVILAERSRIARELHDTLIQGFSGVTMEMQALTARLTRNDERETLIEIVRDAAHCLREARRSVAGLRNSATPESGLAASIEGAARQLTEAKDVRLKLKLDRAVAPLAPDAEYNLLRIAQEAIANAVKHSGARTIEVALQNAAGSLRLSIQDDGSGLAARNADYARLGHYGIIGMKERASQIGAVLTIESAPGAGTQVILEKVHA